MAGVFLRLFNNWLMAAMLIASALGFQKAPSVDSIEQFVSRADSIFIGMVVYQESFRRADSGIMLTRTLFEVEETIKGSRGRRIEVVEYGGRLGNEVQTVSHTPHYFQGQKYLVFTSFSPQGRYRTLGGDQGRFEVVRDHTGKQRIRLSSHHPLRTLMDKTSGETFPEADALRRTLQRLLK